MVGWQWRTPELTVVLGTILTQAYKVPYNNWERRRGHKRPSNPELHPNHGWQLTSPHLSSMLKARGTPSWEGSDFGTPDCD